MRLLRFYPLKNPAQRQRDGLLMIKNSDLNGIFILRRWSLVPPFKKTGDINVRVSRPFLLLEHLSLFLMQDFHPLLAIDWLSLRFKLINYWLGSLVGDK